MDAPDPPPAPDPREIARTDAEFNRINQITPFGNLIFSGPNRNTATLSLTPELQANTDLRLESDSAILQSALERQGLLNQNPIDLSQFGDIQTGIDTSGINFSGPNLTGLPALQAPELQGVNSNLNLQSGIQGTDIPGAPSLQTGVGTNLPIQSQISNPFQIQGSVASNPGAIQSNVNTPFSIQSGVNAPLGIQSQADVSVDTSGLPAIPQDISRFRGDVEQAVFDRGRALLDPVFSDQQRALEQRLANQGLPRAGEAVDRDLERFGRGRNQAFTDLANRAVITGGQEASRALGDVLAARGQGFGEGVTGANLNLAGGQFANQASGQAFGRSLAQGGFANQAAAQGFNQALAQTELGNRAEAQRFGQGLAGGQFANQAAAQGLNQALAQGGFANQAQAQDFQQALASGQFGNEARLGQFGAGLSGANAQFGQNLAQGQFGNQSQLDALNAQMAAQGFNNQAGLLGLGANQGIRGQLTGEQFAQSQANNAASQANLGLQQQILNNQNAARAQQIAEQQAIRGNQFNELASLMGLQQVQAPGISSFFAPGQADVTNAFALNQQAQQNAFEAQNQNNAAGLGGLFSLGAAALGGPMGGALAGMMFGGGGGGGGKINTSSMFGSDIRLKKSIEHIGWRNGHKIYQWEWNELAEDLGLDDSPTVGVIAQEVIDTGHVYDVEGILMVDYEGLWNG